jgi:hypothetical protein
MLGKDPMFLEQAIFTSLKTPRQEGYQLAGVSPGVSADVARELEHWGPAHDSLCDPRFPSVNFHPLESGEFCISKTSAEGNEYSGRGGPRVYTQMLIASRELLARFANNPFAVLEAVTAGGGMCVHDKPPANLERIRLLGRASVVNHLRLAELAGDPGADALVNLVHLTINAPRVAVRSHVPLERLLSGLMSLLPVRFRTKYSFSTGLRYSPRRPFHIIALPEDLAEQRNLQKTATAKGLDLTRNIPATDKLSRGWAYLIRDVFRSGHLSVLPELLRRADLHITESTPDDVAAIVEAEVQAEAS